MNPVLKDIYKSYKMKGYNHEEAMEAAKEEFDSYYDNDDELPLRCES